MRQLPLDLGLTPIPTLHDFVPGTNAAALAHIRQCVEGAVAEVKPTYLWGNAGSGKTHLLHATAQALRERGTPFGWMNADTNPTGDGAIFQPHWQVVIMDDTDHYDTAQQQLAFNWFINALHPSEGAPLWVLAAGALPVSDLPLREDLRTRLGWGYSFALHPLGDEDVRTVLQHAARQRGLALTDEALNYMQNHFSRDLGSLSELLNMLDNYALNHRRSTITIPLLKQMMNEC